MKKLFLALTMLCGMAIAFVVTALPKPAHYFEPSDTLLTKGSKDSIQ